MEQGPTRDSDPCLHPERPIAISRSLLRWLLRSGVDSPRFSCCLLSNSLVPLLKLPAFASCNKIIHAPSAQSFVFNPLLRVLSTSSNPSPHDAASDRRTAASIPILLPADEGNALQSVTRPPSKRLRETVSPTTASSPSLVHLCSIRFFFGKAFIPSSPREPRTQ